MDTLSLLRDNLLSPPLLAFVAGVVAVLIKSDLTFPREVYQALTIYLLLAIGFKGGHHLAEAPLAEVAPALLAGVLINAAIPLVTYPLCRYWMKLSRADAAAIGAHYGSVSAVTYITATVFLESMGQTYEGYLAAIMAAMELPGILVALIFVKSRQAAAKPLAPGQNKVSWGGVLHEVLAGKSFVLLFTGLIAGALSGPSGLERVSPFLIEPFYGVLMLFLLEMGLVAGSRLKDLREGGWKLAVFALAMPPVFAFVGICAAKVAGLSPGGALLLSVLTGSASYIAAPAAVRMALPEASPGQYVTASLGITFPFNIAIGIPLYWGWIQSLYGLS